MDYQQKINIRDTFKRFADREASFNDCCDAFFDALNINLTAQSSEPLDFKELYLERMNADTMPQYLETGYSQMEKTFFLGVITDETLSGNHSNDNLKTLVHKDYSGFVVFGVELNEGKYTRTDLANITRGFNKISFDNPVIAFIRYGNLLTIAACERTNYQSQKLTAMRGEKLGKVSMLRDINLEDPHHGHIDVLGMMDFSSCNTFNEVYTKWQEVFSTQTLTDKFYKELYNWFIWAQDEDLDVYFPNKIETEDDDRKGLEEKLIRLITRIIFVWFLKQKDGLIPDWIFTENQLKNILKNFDPESTTDGSYYNAIIQNLFFATLNKPKKERGFADAGASNSQHFGIKTLFRDTNSPYKDRIKIAKEDFVHKFDDVPFLNGGLFECLDKVTYQEGKKYKEELYDGFSTNCKRFDDGKRHCMKRAFVPNVLFFGEQGLIPLFRRYYFTVEENTPLEQDISLDPELLGKVFENLLGAYNPETKDTVRKSTGSYYTPQEIVNYMVNQSLAQYLAESDDEKQRLLDILDYKTDDGIAEQDKRRLLSKLYDCKVFDPACGSGAFPMGMLNQMVRLLNVLDPENTLWKNTVKDKNDEEKNRLLAEIKNKKLEDLKSVFDIEDEAGRDKKWHEINAEYESLKKSIEDNFSNSLMEPNYWRKLYLIQNCIFGSDIQKIAMQITKLRFFISLIVDQKIDRSKGNFGILPMPNLETKFVCANTLLPSKMQQYAQKFQNSLGGENLVADPKLLQMRNQLFEIREKYFYVKNVDDKKELKKQDRQLCKDIQKYIIDSRFAPDEYKISLWQSEIDKANAELLTVQEPKIVLKEIVTTGNLFGTGKESKIERIDVNAQRRKELKMLISENEKKIYKELHKSSDPEFIAAVQQVTTWDPYDQNASAEFFDANFMFNIQDGFNIVIGNPPYVQLQNNGGKLAKEYENCKYESFAKTGDIYCLFYERAHQLLKDDGLCCYITSNKWMRAGYGEAVRTFFSSKTNPLLLIDFAGVKVFDSATVDTNIIIFSKHSPQNKTLACCAKTLSKQDLKNLALFVKNNAVQCSFPSGDSWVILSPIEQSIKQKIEAVGTPLKDWDINIYRGVLTGFNDAFIITTEKKDEILSACQTDEERQKTAEIIRPILRGRDIKRYGCDWAGLWLIATFPSKKYNIDKLPAIKNHLLSFGKERLEQTGKKYNGFTARKKTNNKWFETQDSISYWDDFNKPKIVYMEIQTDNEDEGYPFPCFSFDESNAVIMNTGYIMTSESIDVRYILGVLNSKLGKILTKMYVSQLQKRQFRMLSQFVSNFPIVVPKDTDILQISKLTRERLETQNIEIESTINSIVYRLYQLDNEEIDFIESNVR